MRESTMKLGEKKNCQKKKYKALAKKPEYKTEIRDGGQA